MDMSWHGMYVQGGRQEYHDPVQKVHQLESVVSVVGGVCADGVVVLRQESPMWSVTFTQNFVGRVNFPHITRFAWLLCSTLVWGRAGCLYRRRDVPLPVSIRTKTSSKGRSRSMINVLSRFSFL